MPDDLRPPKPAQPKPERQWGKPGATVFQVGPAPRAAPQPVAPSPLRQAPAYGGVLSGSLVPPARPRPPSPASTTAQHAAIQTARQAVQTAPGAPLDLTVKPLPGAEAEHTPAARLAPRPENEKVAAPPSLGLARPARQGSSRAPLVLGAGLLIVALIAGGLWLFRQTTPSLPVSEDAPSTPLAIESAASATRPIETTPPVAARPVRQAASSAADDRTIAPASPAVAVRTRPESPVQPVAAATSPPPVVVNNPPAPIPLPSPRVEPPVVVVAPPTPPPTSAERAPSDPDASVPTRPQPLD